MWAVNVVACVSTSRPAPRDGANEVREYLGSQTHAATTPDAISRDPQIAWRADVGHGTVGAPAVGERISVVATVDRWVYAFDTRSGQTYWRYRSDGPYGTGPLIDGGRVYAASEGRDGFLVALNLYTGRRVWRKAAGDVAGPLVIRDSVLFGVTQLGGVAFAIGTGRGQTLWTRKVGPARSGVALAGRHVVVATLTDTLFVIDAAKGTVVTRTPLEGSTVAAITLANDSTAILASPAGSVTAVAIPGGRVRWRVTTDGAVFGAAVVAGDTAFALTNRCTLWTIPLARPAAATSVPIGCVTVAGPTVVRGGVLVATVRGEVLLFDRATRTTVWSRQLEGEIRHPPILRDRQLVVAPITGKVVSFR
ncbi:MAG: PQQ-binding-like beta-propeller repeat protein [Gemmatimonadaceae bacterium]